MTTPAPMLRLEEPDLVALFDEVIEVLHAAEAWRRAPRTQAAIVRLAGALRVYLWAWSLLPKSAHAATLIGQGLSLEVAIALRSELRDLLSAVMVWDTVRRLGAPAADVLEADAMIVDRLDALQRRREALRQNLAAWRASV